VRDWIHVLDHCRGIDLALSGGRPGAIYNFGGSAEMSNLQLVETLLDLLGKPSSLIRFVADRPGHDQRYAMDFNLARKELGFEPEYDFQRGLSETLEWYAGNRQWLESVESGEYRNFMHDWYGERQ
jgi:dTDP-glucose 4,6-dehydratase